MSVCEVNSDTVDFLKRANDYLLKLDDDKRKEDIKRIEDNRENIKAVLLTLCKCTETSRLNLVFGNKREINVSKLLYCIGCVADMRDCEERHDITLLSEDDVDIDYLLVVVNEVSKELYGVTYRLLPPDESWGDYKFIWEDETLGEWLRNYFIKSWCFRKSPVGVLFILFFWVCVPLFLLILFCQFCDECEYLKMSFSCRDI